MQWQLITKLCRAVFLILTCDCKCSNLTFKFNLILANFHFHYCLKKVEMGKKRLVKTKEKEEELLKK
jgi:hypothetical protein